MMEQTRYFYCYSERFKRALVANGFHIIREGFNHHSKTRYWVFRGSAAFNYYKDNLYQLERDKF